MLTASAARAKAEPPPRPLATPETTVVAPAIAGAFVSAEPAKPGPDGADDKEAEAQPLPPPKADPGDPLQMRAVAIGLHPEISRAVLARLTPADFKNAEYAIRTALAEGKDSAVFVWPRQRKPELALFHVRFVRGGAEGCRRYVVTVTKDGWLTTALPMERCGPQGPLPREAAARH